MNNTEIYNYIASISDSACKRMNTFSANILKTRGGRIGSGMGALLEAFWGYMMNQIIAEDQKADCEIAWFPDNQYNDFSCIKQDKEWNPANRDGEFFRIEVKSMNVGADESKAHFCALQKEIEENDVLLILIWEWKKIDKTHYSPIVIDAFFDRASAVAKLRDALHLARGGSFVSAESCPDNCDASHCSHIGEPLNENGKRERPSGPEATRVSSTVSYAANFGGLVRMIKTNNDNARNIFREQRKSNVAADHYISFIHRNFLNEEKNHFTISELRKVAELLGISTKSKTKDQLYEEIHCQNNYQNYLRQL